MIAISEELRQAVNESETKLVYLVDPETNAEYVVLPARKICGNLQERDPLR